MRRVNETPKGTCGISNAPVRLCHTRTLLSAVKIQLFFFTPENFYFGNLIKRFLHLLESNPLVWVNQVVKKGLSNLSQCASSQISDANQIIEKGFAAFSTKKWKKASFLQISIFNLFALLLFIDKKKQDFRSKMNDYRNGFFFFTVWTFSNYAKALHLIARSGLIWYSLHLRYLPLPDLIYYPYPTE